VRYEWDERKNRENWRKHGISFELATLVFEDRLCLFDLDRVDSGGEQRWHAIGRAQIGPDAPAVLFVAHAYREDAYGEEIIRIISARETRKHELRRYREQALD
jgi:uncharacterized protein